MIKLKDLLLENKLKELKYFRDKLWDIFKYAATHQNEKRGEAAFYGMLIKLAKKSKFYPHAGKNEVELHGKIVFTKAFDEVRNKRVNLKKYEYDYKGWPKHVKEFIENMGMYSD